MLKILRKKGVAKKILWFVAVIIIISFGFFGTASMLSGQKSDHAGKIFGKKISFNTFEKAFKFVSVHALIQYGENYKKFLNIESEAWDQLILLNEADKRKIKISNDQLAETISRYSFFQKDGKFDQEMYERVVTYALRMRPVEFEESIRQRMKIFELYDQETKNANVTDHEVLEAYNKNNEKVQISYIFIDPNKYINEVTVTAEEIEKYYAENKSEFLKTPTVNVDYISFDFPEIPVIEKQKDTSDEEYSNEKLDAEKKYNEQKKAIIEKANNFYYELINNTNTDEAIKQANLELKNTGFFSMEKPNLSLGGSYPLLNKIFQLKKNEITEPFETNTGVIIAKLKEKKDAYIPEFEEAKNDVKQSLLKKKSFELAKEKGSFILNDLADEFKKSKLKDFSKAAKNLKLEIYQTPSFNRGQYLPKIGISKEFQEAAFELSKEKLISDVIETTNGFCILHLDDYTPADEKEFEKQKEELLTTALQTKKTEMFREFLTKLRLMAKLENNMSLNTSESQ